MNDATLELEACKNVFNLSTERQGGLADVAQPPVESTVDQSLIEIIRRALCATGYLELRNLDVRISDRCVTLDGQVPRYHLKQLAQSAATQVPGIARIVNTVEVVYRQ